MLNISDALKEKYINGSGLKHLKIRFPDIGLTLKNENIVTSSMTLKESLCNNSTIDYKGCISTQFSISVGNLATDIGGERIEVSLTLDDDTEEIPLFHGFVDTVEKQDTSTIKKIICYDLLYSQLSNRNVASWYSSIYYPCTIGQFRTQLFSYLNLDYIDTVLPADNVIIDMVYNTDEMSALEVIKQICQINGVFGIINRDNKFEFRRPDFKSKTEEECVITLDTLKGIKRYEEVNPLFSVELRDNVDDDGYVISPSLPISGTSMYIIQGNMFVLNLQTDYRELAAQNLAPLIKDDVYTPFSVDISGYPFLEVGDRIAIKNLDYSSGTPVEVTTYTTILSRTLKGLPALTDTFSADGSANEDTIISDGTQFTAKVNSSNSIAKNMGYVTYQNLLQDYLIRNERMMELINITYYITRATHLCIDMQFLIDVDTLELSDEETYTTNDCDIEFFYYLDGVLVELERPLITSVDGHTLIRLRHDIPASEVGVYQWQVFCKVKNGDVYIPERNIICIMNADGLASNEGWNGTIMVTETVDRFDLSMFSDFTDDAEVTLPTVLGGAATDTLQRVDFGAMLGGFTDSGVSASPVMVFTAFTNADKLTVESPAQSGVYRSPNTIITDNVFNISSVDPHDNNAIFFASFDDGETWLGYNEGLGEWVANVEMTRATIMRVPESAWQSPCRIKIMLNDSDATFTGINLYGGTTE